MKSISNITRRRIEPRFGLARDVWYLGCDDGTTYIMARADGGHWGISARVDRDGSVSHDPSRYPAAVENQLWAVRKREGQFSHPAVKAVWCA
jgi:hypothetical protein